MVTSLKLKNFKIGERRSFSFDDRISVVEGDVGASRALALDAFRLLLMAFRNSDSGVFPSAWIAGSNPTSLSVSVANYDYPELTYAVTMQRVGDKTQILTEKVSAGEKEMLTRSGGYYHVGPPTRDRLRISDTQLAIYEAVGQVPDDDPVWDVKKELQEMWLVAPDAFRMGSGIVGGPASNADTTFAQLATYIAFRTKLSEAVRLSMMDYLHQHRSAGITGFSVQLGLDGKPCLFVKHRNDLNLTGVPFGSLDNSEKMLFLAAFVCAVNENAVPLSVVWDSPTNWLGSRGGSAVIKMLRRSFSRRGQLVLLS